MAVSIDDVDGLFSEALEESLAEVGEEIHPDKIVQRALQSRQNVVQTRQGFRTAIVALGFNHSLEE